MKDQQEYTRDIEEIRSMMERSTKFPSRSGLAGIMAGLYALIGSYVAYYVFRFHPESIAYNALESGTIAPVVINVIMTAIVVLILSISTAIYLTNKKAGKTGEKVWNATSRRFLVNLAMPLIAGAIFAVILIFHDLIGLVAPVTLLFYGLALYGAGKFTYDDVKFLGIIQMGLGLVSSYNVEYGVLFWAIGFGFVHIMYGIYMHFKYER